MSSSRDQLTRRLSLASALVAAAVSALAGAGPAIASEAPHAVPGEALVRFESGVSSSERRDAIEDAGAQPAARLDIPRTQVVSFDGTIGAAVRRLERQGEIELAQPNFRYSSLAVDPRRSEQWGLTGSWGVGAPTAWATTRGQGATVAVVDSGIDPFHPDLVGRVDEARGYDFIENDSDPDDYNGHGTHVAGTVAASADNSIGVAGVAPQARLIGVRVLDGAGDGDTDSVAQGIEYAANQGADVINLSLGGPAGADDQILADAIAQAAQKNAVVVAAAGNEGSNNDSAGHAVSPCNLTAANLICVAAITEGGGRAGFSNYGPTSVDLGAPGNGVLSTTAPFDTLLGDGFAAGGLTGWSATANSWGVEGNGNGGYWASDSPGTTSPANKTTQMSASSSLDLTSRLGCRIDADARFELTDGPVANVMTDDDQFVFGATANRSSTLTAWTGTSAGYDYGAWEPLSVPLSAAYNRSSTLEGSAGVKPLFRVKTVSGGSDGASVDNVRVLCRSAQAAEQADSVGGYGELSGTSMATPHVSGVAALTVATRPTATAAQVVNALRRSVVPNSTLKNITTTGGVVSATRAVDYIAGKGQQSGQGNTPPGGTATVPAPTPAPRPAPRPPSAPAPPVTHAKAPCSGLRGSKLRKCKLARKIKRVCSPKRSRKARRVCAKRLRALDRCSTLRSKTRKQKARKKACVRKARRIGAKKTRTRR